jgi:two-component system response regulator VicR
LYKFKRNPMNKILIFDDDTALLEVLEIILSENGFEVTVSRPVTDIFPMVTLYQPDLIILDYLMKEVNGGELCGMLKKNLLTQHIPVIILSAYDKVIRSLGSYGCDLFIAKPFDLNFLVRNIEKLIFAATTY